ncbi:MAG: AbrB/MazE/SpoVT family DNA-binding domain-containing protein [Promethearchaeota archaeon]
MVMVVRIDKQGRIVLPKEIRDKYHFDPGQELTILEREGGIEIHVRKDPVSFKEIFGQPLRFDPDKVLTLDVANFDEMEG